MVSPEGKMLQSWLAPAFKDAGFSKSAATWHRQAPSLTQAFNIRGSQWSRSFYLNLGVYISALGTLERPTEPHWHLQESLIELVPDRELFIQLCDFEQELPEEHRRKELIKIVSAYAIPWFDRMRSTDQLRHFIIREMKHGLPISAATYTHLGINADELDSRRRKLFQQAQRRAESTRSDA